MVGYLFYVVGSLFRAVGNALRRMMRAPDFVVFTLEGPYPELKQPPGNLLQRILRPPRPSLQELAEQVRTVARDPRTRGVVLHLRPLGMPRARLDTLRDLIGELRRAGKRVVAWSTSYDEGTYYVACAADEVLLLPGGTLAPLGLRRGQVYLADALERIGLRADVLQISPYKSAGDILSRREMSDEVREMTNWLLDGTYVEVVQAIAQGRGLDEDGAKALIDHTPCTDLQAKERGAIDEILSEEELPAYLQPGGRPPSLMPWQQAARRLLRRRLPRPGRYVALVSIEGMIVDGQSQQPPVEPPIPLPLVADRRAGDLSVVPVVRRVTADRRAAAVVLYVDSRGGSATASESMRAALARLAAKKPLVVAMGDVAASGGYWVSTPGRTLIAQPNTITGSIGVLLARVRNAGLLDNLLVKREVIARGESALIDDLDHRLTEGEREKLWQYIERIYDLFLDRVADSRRMAREAVDAVGAGRVWTGRQALAHGLIDELGGLEQALGKARRLGGLSEDAPVRMMVPTAKPVAPLPDTAAALHHLVEGIRLLIGPTPLCIYPFLDNDLG
jgi:protease IV